MGMAVAALDAWLYASYVGYKGQCYSAYQCGSYWTSHTMIGPGGFREHCAWQAMRMRNNCAYGDIMLKTRFTSVPDASSTPLAAAYVLTNATRSVYSVILLNLKLPGTHSGGTNFGDGFTPLTVNLPFTQRPQAIYLSRLARRDGSFVDAYLTNRDSVRVVIRTDTISPSAWSQQFVVNAATGADSRGLPPANMFLYVYVLDSSALSVRSCDAAGTMAQLADAPQPASVPFAPIARAPVCSGPNAPPLMSVRPSAKEVAAQGEVIAPAGVPQVLAWSMPGDADPTRPVDAALKPPTSRTPPVPPVTAEGPSPRDMTWHGAQGALPIAAVSASSASGTNLPRNTIDRDLRTRWSAASGGQWLGYDLGGMRSVAGATLVWYAPRGTALPVSVSVSEDGINYREVRRASLAGRGTRSGRVDFPVCNARFVRMAFGRDGDPAAPNVYEVALFGDTGGLQPRQASANQRTALR
jgi:hypothetical protein